MAEPNKDSLDKMWKFVKGFADKSGTAFHPTPAVTESVVNGLAANVDELGKPLCPCNFYKDKQAEAKLRRWICACDEMQIYKYCHCHEGREIYGLITDPTPDKGRALRHRAPAAIPSNPTADGTQTKRIPNQ
jgi:ferredoxin-thioredoxin reductase catalytic chain